MHEKIVNSCSAPLFAAAGAVARDAREDVPLTASAIGHWDSVIGHFVSLATHAAPLVSLRVIRNGAALPINIGMPYNHLPKTRINTDQKTNGREYSRDSLSHSRAFASSSLIKVMLLYEHSLAVRYFVEADQR